MQRIMLRSKIHLATITATELDYEGSIAIDQDLLDKADILIGEQVQVLNLSNGARFLTYTIAGQRGSGRIMLNGPAARLGAVGDKIIVLSYCNLPDEEARRFKPIIVHVDGANKLEAGN